MSSLNKILFIVFVIILTGCSKPVIQTEYVEVAVPVRYELDRPSRPVRDKDESVPVYLARLLEYVSQLEVIIDEHSGRD